MKIKLRDLVNLTELAPQPMASAGPVPAPVAPMGMGASPAPEMPAPESPEQPQDDASPQPEDPSEYDFTKDFREFEDKKNKAEADAKKVLKDKMNERLLNKTIVANASRGYGQPKTDYTIENVKKVSVEFWYKDYVVIISDKNDKQYFLTPGINIKIEGSGSEPAPDNQETPEAGKEQKPEAPAPQPPSEEPSEKETPNNVAQTPPPAPDQTATTTPQPKTSVSNPTTQPQPEPEEEPTTFPPKKKKVPQPVAESIQRDLNMFLVEFMSNKVKNKNGKVNFIPYINQSNKILSENNKIKYELLIPENHMINNIDNRDVRLASIDVMRQPHSKGSINIIKHGRYYLLEYIKETI